MRLHGEASNGGGRPHVLFLLDNLWALAGAEGVVLRATRFLPAQGYRCSVGTFHELPTRGIAHEFPCPVYEFPLTRAVGLGAFRTAVKLRRFIVSEHVDIVHTFFETADLWGGVVAKLSGCPVLISSRRDMGILRSRKHDLGYRALSFCFDQVQAVSEQVRQFTIQRDHLDPARVVTIPNGVEIDRIAATDPDPDLRRSLAANATSPFVVSVGHLRPVKGLDVLIRAAVQVCAELPETRFLIVGRFDDPPVYHQQLLRLVQKLGLTHNVHFLGGLDNVWPVLKACDIFCLLSRSEGMSNALLEAMACGLPCVATAVGGNPEVIEDGRDGYLVPNEDPQTAANRILDLLRNPEQAKGIGHAAKQTIMSRFLVQHMIARMTRTYESFLPRCQQAAP